VNPPALSEPGGGWNPDLVLNYLSMSKTSPLDIHRLLRKYGLRPDHSLGQNFLVDQTGLDKVISAAQIAPGEDVLEIGSGVGNLTRLLAEIARQVVAVEIDKQLIPPLREVLGEYQNVRIIEGDILKLNPSELMASEPYLVVANIPYYITSALLRHLLETQTPPKRLVLTVQREVAERICASPNQMSLLALSVQVYGHPAIVARLPAGAFYPPPQVDSAVIRVDLHRETGMPPEQLDLFFRLAKAGFSQKRKTLRNTLSGGMAWNKKQSEAILTQAGIATNRRAETLSLDEWKTLAEVTQSANIF
jgi:16S rRNA (adenine1518-N6/adenine1519-N6)-dimethyltransferase